ncbi:hypothetical protein [Methylophaga sp. OBS4]|uniref:hypothetical protein n=1 Tax=Methylophaga sp. OBS4 TaxID=2991935 RepID=UPI00224F0FD1|nr:hypothetical protein [Methylophaga sp. OBS4]MCX4188065.1 hypothetical protein [Methylophaga sp. OBS4]
MAETDSKAEENNEGGEKKKLSLSTPVLIAIAGGLLVVIIALAAVLFFFRSSDTPAAEDQVAVEQLENIADSQAVEAPAQGSEQQQDESNNLPLAVQDETNQSDTEDTQAPLVTMPTTSATNAVVAAAASQIPTQTLSTASRALPDANGTQTPSEQVAVSADSAVASAEQIAAGFVTMQQQLSALQEENQTLRQQIQELTAELKYKDDIIHRRQVMKNLADARSKQKFEPKLDIKLEPKWGNSEQR